MELSYNEGMRERAKVGCKACLASNMWQSRDCPLRKTDKKFVSQVSPLVSDSGLCPVDGASQVQQSYSEIILAIESHVFPYKGGTLDQPYAFIEAFLHVKGKRAMAETERMERIRKK